MGWTKRGVTRIRKLTPGQEQKLPLFAKKWDRIARSTEPMDDSAGDRATEGIRRFLKATGCRKPKLGIWEYVDLPEKAFETASFYYRDAEKYNPKMMTLESREPGSSLYCLLIRSFEPTVVSTVDNFMRRNIARPPRSPTVSCS